MEELKEPINHLIDFVEMEVNFLRELSEDNYSYSKAHLDKIATCVMKLERYYDLVASSAN